MTTKEIEINRKKYQIIDDTQSDGRCFSASIYYLLFNVKADDNALNIWIQENIIDPIIDTENTDCIQFFNWATKWAAMNKHSPYEDDTNVVNPNFIIDERISILQQILDRIIQDNFLIKNSISHTDTKQHLIDAIDKLLDSMRIFNDPTTHFHTFMGAFPVFKELIDEFVDVLNNNKTNLDKIIKNTETSLKNKKELPEEPLEQPMKVRDTILVEISEGIIDLTKNICEETKLLTEYNDLADEYKKYIKSLNQINASGYEWTEPEVGPIDVLLKKKNTADEYEIKSINIYKTSTLKVESVIRKQKQKKDESKNLYLYYEGNSHYKPLLVKPTPAATGPAATGSTATGSTATGSTSPKPATKPAATKPATKPAATGSTATKPAATGSTATKPAATGSTATGAATGPTAPATTSTSTQTSTPSTIPNKKEVINNINIHKKIDKKQIPNSLIIYITTRIPNAYKLNYEPFMTVPKSTSHTVYFDPLIKYYERPIKNIPSTAPKDTKYSQFFEAPAFDTMINRILSDFRYMQKPRSFEEAFEQNIIENNIKITIKNLFKKNGLFYIDKKPYTIIGVKSNPFDWQIDKKPLEKLLNHFSHLSIDQIQKQANEEENNFPDDMMQGNVASSNITSDENMSIITSSLQNNSENLSKENMKNEILGNVNAFIDVENFTTDKNSYMSKLYTKYLSENSPINYSNITHLTTDPLTFSLLIKPSDLVTFIKSDMIKHKKLLDLYPVFIRSKQNLKNTDYEYKEKSIELANFNEDFNNQMRNFANKFFYFNFNKTHNQEDTEEEIKEKEESVETIKTLKVKYMSLIFDLAELINKIYTFQNIYFTATKELLNEIKKNYTNIIQKYDDQTLEIECIDNDILFVQLLINEDPKNLFSKKYFSNYNKFKIFYTRLNNNKKKILEPKINYMDEMDFYTDNPYVLNIETKLYEIYNFQMSLFYSYNQSDIWVILFKTNQIFTSNIFEKSTNIIKKYEVLKNVIDSPKYQKYQKYINKNTVHIVPIKKDKKSTKYDWNIENNDGKKIIEDNDKNGQKFQKVYIDYVKKSVNAYDAIILYIYLLEKYCLIQNGVYISERNIIQLNLEYELSLDNYYLNILEYIKDTPPKNPILIPSSIFWDTTNFNNEKFIEEKRSKYQIKYFIYVNRLRTIKKSRKEIILRSQDLYKQITPNISKKAFIEQCNKIINKEETIIPPYSLGNTIDNIYDDFEKYDFENINKLNYNISKLVDEVIYDRIINIYDEKYDFDWIIFKNDGKFYNALADGLNRELELTNKITINKYTEEKNGKQIFTAKLLEKLVNEIKIPLITNKIMILENTLDIKFIIFKMFKKVNKGIDVGDIVLFKENSYRVILISKNSLGALIYDLYDGFNILRGIENTDEIIEKEILDKTGKMVKKRFKVKSIKKDISNPLEEFRIYCDSISKNDFDKYTNYMYFVITEDKGKENIQLVRDLTIDNSYIFEKDKIPIYVKYLIFNSCPKIRDDNFFIEFNDKINANTDIDQIDEEIIYINEKIIKKEKILRDIKKKITEIQKRKKILKESGKSEEAEKEEKEEKIKEKIISNEIYKLNQQLKTLEKKRRDKKYPKTTTGGKPTTKLSEQYSQYSTNYPVTPSRMPQNIIYYPSQGYNQGYPNQGYNQQMLPYNIIQNNIVQNKAKDQKSKLTFYIEIELELFPGESANIFQKSVVKCQSTFERIREAWADIRGFEYRPSPMNEAYAYNITSDEEQRKQRKEERKQKKQRKQQKKTLKNNIRNNNNKTLKQTQMQ